MQIDIRGNVALSPALEQYAERRVQMALGHFVNRLPLVTVRLNDDNGPKGGVDKRCQVTLQIPRATAITIDEHHADLYAAIDLAADRAGRAVSREFERRRARRALAAELRNGERTGIGRRPPLTAS